MFYDGRPKLEPGAVVCRVAPSFVRFGNFEIFAARRGRHCCARCSTTRSSATSGAHEPSTEAYVALFEEVVGARRRLIVHWQRVGFVHGVMNTDNLSILGLTIDYGPYGWLEDYDPDWTPNTTDARGRRYRFGNQPQDRAVEPRDARQRAAARDRRLERRCRRRSTRSHRASRTAGAT
jgi:uncharacterized protein YdiU (UPF0061 family)